jgi:hypothetical protein
MNVMIIMIDVNTVIIRIMESIENNRTINESMQQREVKKSNTRGAKSALY